MKKILITVFLFFVSISLYSQTSPKTINECVKNNYFEIVDIVEDDGKEEVTNHKICRAYIFKNEENFDLYIKYILELNYLEGITMKTISDLKAIASTSNEDDSNSLDYKILKEHNAEYMVYIKYFTEKDINYRRFYFVRLYKNKIYTSYDIKRNAF